MMEHDMLPNKYLVIFISLLLVIPFVSCGKHPNPVGTIPSETPIIPSGNSASPTISPRFTCEPTRLETTQILPASGTPIITTTSLETSTITPTTNQLSIEDAQNRLHDLFTDNGACLLPCFWGITPGFSTSWDGKIILESLSGISLFTVFDSNHGIINLLEPVSDLDILINVSFLVYPSNEVISRISFNARAMQEITGGHTLVHVFNSVQFGELIDIYMLPQILSEYGSPSSVLISALAEPLPQERGGDTGDFRIMLLYPEQGILVNYKTNINVIGEHVVGCLNNAHVTLELYPSGNGEHFIENLDQSLQDDIQENYKPIEEATNLSTDEFYQIYSISTDECLATPSVLWPIPDW